MKKSVYIFITALLFGCNFQNIEITGIAPGMDDYTASIFDNNKIIYGANIQSGKFEIAKQLLNQPGYYFLRITFNKQTDGPGMGPYEVYLEPGKYHIAIKNDEKAGYPDIQSSSAIQNDLGIYHRFTDSIFFNARKESDNWIARMNDPKAQTLPDKDYQQIIANVKLWQGKLENIVTETLAKFIAKYPNNKAVLHAMGNMDMEKDPAKFLAIYQKLNPDIKNSDEGKQIDDKLKILNKLMPGSLAPAFTGETPDGKKVNIKDLHKKIIIVAFWRSGSQKMIDEQYGLANNLVKPADSNKVGIVSVSFDTDRNKWLNGIKKSGLNHVQITDLKGDDSPNASNWNITTLPNYYLVDDSGKILYNNLSYQALSFSIDEYLAKH